VVNDGSTDDTATVVSAFSETYPFVTLLNITSSQKHLPGSKVIQAFNEGLATLDTDYDIMCKFDADLIFPKNYLDTIAKIFQNNPKCGMAGGFCTIKKQQKWTVENL